jgi:drug/metabolite transporter (DMT)-like permease
VSRRGWALFAAMSLIWGMPYLLIKIAVGGVSAPVLVLARVAIGAALLLPFALRHRQLAAIKPVWRWVALFAFVEVIVPWLVLSEAERSISSSLTGLLIASVPIMVAVIGLLIGSSDRLSPTRWVGLFIGLIGVGLLAGPNLIGSGATGAVAKSVSEVLFVAFCYAVGPQIANRKLGDVPPVAMTTVCLSLAAVVYAPLAALSWPAHVPSAKVLLSIAGLAVVCTAAAFLLFFRLISEVGPVRASVITYVNPAIAVSLGVAVLGEKVTPIMLVAFATILAGSLLATRPARTPAAVAARGFEPDAKTQAGARTAAEPDAVGTN